MSHYSLINNVREAHNMLHDALVAYRMAIAQHDDDVELSIRTSLAHLDFISIETARLESIYLKEQIEYERAMGDDL